MRSPTPASTGSCRARTCGVARRSSRSPSSCVCPSTCRTRSQEGAAIVDTLALFDKLGDETAALCTHGDVVGELLRYCRHQGVDTGDEQMAKGSIWVFETEAGAIVDARYVPPPE